MNKKIPAFLVLLLGAGLAAMFLYYTQIPDRDAAREAELSDAEVGMFLQFERKVTAVRQAVQNGILAEDEDYLIQASRQSVEVFDLIQDLTSRFPEAEGLESAYQDYYAQLVSIITLFMENRLEQGRARLLELEQSHGFIEGKMRAIVDTVTGEGCLPCFQELK